MLCLGLELWLCQYPSESFLLLFMVQVMVIVIGVRARVMGFRVRVTWL